jgi:hypothetical protein
MHLSLILLTRPGRAVASVAVVGLLALAQGAIALHWQASGHGSGPLLLALVLLFAAAVGGTAVALDALVPLAGRRGRLGRRLAQAGLGTVLVAHVATVGLGAPLRVASLAGLGIALAGLWLVSAAARRTGEVAPWTPAAVAAGLAATVVFPAGGAVALGLAWLAVAGSLWDTHGARIRPAVA